MVDELQNKAILIKARLFEIAESRKEEPFLRDELCNLVGEMKGRAEAKQEYEKKFGFPLTPEIEEKLMAIIRDLKAKTAETPKP